MVWSWKGHSPASGDVYVFFSKDRMLRQVEFLQGKLDEALASVNSLTLANEKLTSTVEELRKQTTSLEDMLGTRARNCRRKRCPVRQFSAYRTQIIWYILIKCKNKQILPFFQDLTNAPL